MAFKTQILASTIQILSSETQILALGSRYWPQDLRPGHQESMTQILVSQTKIQAPSIQIPISKI